MSASASPGAKIFGDCHAMYRRARAARFHCLNLSKTGSGLSHNSYCTLRSDIDTTSCDGSQACACVAGTEAWTARFRSANLMLLVAAVWVVTATICFISLLPLLTGGGQPALVAILVPLVLTASLAPFVVQLVRLTRDRTSASDGTPDNCWKLGQIYINPNDPALVVEKRFGVGYTLNFGNRALWWILMAAVLVFALVIGLR